VDDIRLTEEDYHICMSAVIKCHLLRTYVDAGIELNPLNKKNFGFHKMTDDEEQVLLEKLYKNGERAWLEDQPVEL
jgi:hypothetical protein